MEKDTRSKITVIWVIRQLFPCFYYHLFEKKRECILWHVGLWRYSNGVCAVICAINVR